MRIDPVGPSTVASQVGDEAVIRQPVIARRSPDVVMTLARLGSFHQTRLSFLRNLPRRVAREKWRFYRSLWQGEGPGGGVAALRFKSPPPALFLVCFSPDPPAEEGRG